MADLPIVISKRSFESNDTYEVIISSISFVNALFGEHLEADEVSEEALISYYVDYYLAQMNNGGFSQFVYNSRWAEGVVERVRGGLMAMGASRHAEIFRAGEELVGKLGAEALARFLASDYFGDNEDRDVLNMVNDTFFGLGESEDLIALNAQWIRSRPDLRVLTIDEMQAEVDRMAASIPDRDARIAAAKEAAPRYAKLIHRLCDERGHTLDRITAGDPNFVHEGTTTMAWHFLTDQGHFFMVDTGDQAILFDGTNKTEIARIDV